MERNKIIHWDSLEYMRTLPDNCIDLVLTDPPYWINADKNKRWNTKMWNAKAVSKDYQVKDWDSSIPSKEVFNEIKRISKNQIIWGWNYFIEALENWPCWIVWDKNNWNNWYADCELAWTNFKTAVRLKKFTWHWMIQESMKNKEERFHPTQKPKELFKWCLENYSKPWDIILDCFAWSWTTAVAAIETGRDYIVIEKEKDYCSIIHKRVANTTPPLFTM
jgi:site-specific DNA-methyltransferase (adenine-specific)